MSAERLQSTPESPNSRAMDELQGMIRARYPSTEFRIRPGVDDPETTYLVATVDVDDPDEVLDLVLDRLIQMQVNEGLPISLLPIHTPERVERTRRQVSDRQVFKTTPALPAGL